MEELIKIRKSGGGKNIVSARDLYGCLGATERFSTWFERQLSYGFEQNVDFVGCKVFNALANQELDDFAITLNMEKEISMLQRSEKGKEVRKYFIACEEVVQRQTVSVPTTYLEAMKEVVRLEENRLTLESKIKEDEPKVEAANRLLDSGTNITVGEFAKILGTGPNIYFRWLRGNKFLINGGAKHNLPYQNYLEMGLFKVKEHLYDRGGSEKPHVQTYITPKGQIYLTNKYK